MSNTFLTIEELATEVSQLNGQELVEVFAGGKSNKAKVVNLRKFNSYDVAIGTSTQLSIDNQVTTINNSTSTAKTITLPNNLPAGRAMTLVVVIRGKAGAITWDSRIKWSGSTAPTLANSVTVAVLLWDGTATHGNTGASY